MAFGALKGTLGGNGGSITASNALTGSVSVSVGDLIFVCFGQQTNLTATSASDNLGNTYTAQNAGTDAGAATGRCFYSRVTVPGTLTQINVAATASSNDWAALAAVIEGPVTAPPIDRNPANITSDVTSPFTCPATGTLAQAREIIMSWGAANQSTTWAATSPSLLAGNRNNSTTIKVAVGYQAVTSTSSVSPEFTAGANPTSCVLGTASFKRDFNVPLSRADETDTAQSFGRVKRAAVSQATESDTAQAFGVRKVVALAQALESDTALGLTAQRVYALGRADEIDTAWEMTVGGAKIVPLNQAVEEDTAYGFAARKLLGMAQAEEVDFARALAPIKYVALGRAEEVNFARNIYTSPGGGGAATGWRYDITTGHWVRIVNEHIAVLT